MTTTSDFSHLLTPQHPGAAANPAAHAYPSAAPLADAAPAGRDCIIVADDSDLALSILRRILTPHFDLLEARNGAEIIQFLRTSPKPVSAVLCDIMMPVMDGFQVIDFMQKNGLLAVIPVIAATALADAQSKIQCYEAGAFDVLDKPHDSKFLPFKLRRDIDQFRNLRSLSANPLAQARAEQLEALLSSLPAAIFVEDPASNVLLHCNAIFQQIPGVPENPVGRPVDSFPLPPDMLSAIRSAREALLVHNIAKPVLYNGPVPGTVYSLTYTTFLNPVSSVTQLVGFVTNATHEVQNRSVLEQRIRGAEPRYP
jgi:CheY-like chemotaxis protein